MASRAGLFVVLAAAGLAAPAFAQVQDIEPRAPPTASAAPEDCTDWEGRSLGRAGGSKVRLKICVHEKKVTGRIEFVGDAGSSERDVAGDVLPTGAMVLKDVRLIVKLKVPGWTPALIHRYDFGPATAGRLDGTFDLEFNGWKDHGKIELTKIAGDAGSPLPLPTEDPKRVSAPRELPAPLRTPPSLTDTLGCRCAAAGRAIAPPSSWIVGALLGLAAASRRRGRAPRASPGKRAF